MLRRLPWLIAPFVLMALTTSQPAAASGEPEVRAFWADTFANGLKTRAQIDALVAHAVEANANTIVAQVRRRGDSFYTISIEPFTDDTGVEPGLDPLAYLLEQAHARGLEVHAWVIANSIYSGHPFIPTGTWPCAVPCSPDHAFNTHGIFASGDDNWLTRTHPSFTAGTLAVTSGGVVRVPAGWRLSDGNWWTDPGHPDAAEHTVQVIRHLVANYDVDGLHLDRIRYPEMPIARVGTGPIGFATGYNPVSVRRFNAAYGRPVDALPDLGTPPGATGGVRRWMRSSGGSISKCWRSSRGSRSRPPRLRSGVVRDASAASPPPRRTRASSRTGTAGRATVSST